MEISIVKDFTDTPGARYREQGDFSGQQFREEVLLPMFEEAEKNKEKLNINLDGGYGYPTSFLEEAFGGLSRLKGKDKVLSILSFTSEDEPALVDAIKKYILNADK